MDQLPVFSPIISELNKSTMTVSVSMDKKAISTIAGRTSEYKALPELFRPAMVQISNYVKTTMIPTTFAKEGPGWQKLAQRTIRERRALGYGPRPILRRTSDLLRELTDNSHPKHIEVIKVGKEARIQIGGSSAKFIENQLGKPSQHLPARPMIPGTGRLPLPDRDRIQMQRIIEKAIQQGLNKPK